MERPWVFIQFKINQRHNAGEVFKDIFTRKFGKNSFETACVYTMGQETVVPTKIYVNSIVDDYDNLGNILNRELEDTIISIL